MTRTSATTATLARPEWHRALGRWFRAERRDLPWRRTRDAYAIWISEAMLQQTRVEVVIPYFARFLARFPDVRALAAASEDDVLAQWSGLGYYTRARSLHGAARAIVERHGGVLPRTREQWLALPGVGPYTAGAVLSIAFSASEPLVDGNVERVLARLFELEEPQGSPALGRACWELARALVPRGGGLASATNGAELPRGGGLASATNGAELDPGDWNQALMELGARVCTPRAPRCGECALAADCRARMAGRAEELPRPRARRSPLDVRLEMRVVVDGGRLLLVRRPEKGRMAGMYELPTSELVAEDERARLWPAAEPLGATGASLGEVAHAITHHRIRATVVAAAHATAEAHARTRWTDASELSVLALTGLARKALALAAVQRHLDASGFAP